MNKKVIGILCILFGIVVISVPFLKEASEDNRQEQIQKEWEQEIAIIGAEEIKASSEIENKSSEGELAIGILKIPAIELEQPILKEATKHNLDISLATIEPTGEPGKNGNIAIAGHSSRTYGRHFNRLSEVEKGDEIIIETAGENYTYYMTGNFVVEAEDVWVLENTLEGAEITLVTCYYPEEGETQRLIVKGFRKE